MRKIIKVMGYLGMIIFIVISILNKMINISDKFFAILTIASFIMFLPMLIDEIKIVMKLYK